MTQMKINKLHILMASSFLLSACNTALGDKDQTVRPAYGLENILRVPSEAGRRGQQNKGGGQFVRITGAELSDQISSQPPQNIAPDAFGVMSGQNRVGSTTTASPAEDEKMFDLDIADVDVRDLSALILGKLLGENYLIDEGVTGTVSISTPLGLKKSDLIPVLRAALESRGAELTLLDGFYRVTQTSVNGGLGRTGAGPGLYIMPVVLKHANAADIRRTLLPVAKDLVQITTDDDRNILILSGKIRHLNSLMRLVGSLDIDALAGQEFGLYLLKNAASSQFIKELEGIFPPSSNVKLIAIERLNAVLVVTSQVGKLRKVERWIETLDRAGGKNERQIYVYQAVSGQPNHLAEILASLFKDAGSASNDRQTTRQGASEEAIDQGPLSFAVVRDDDGASDEQRSVATRNNDGPDSAGQGLRIIPDELTDRLFIYATANEWAEIQATLRKLDQTPQQVMIEATIVEVTLNDNLRYGLQFMFNSGDSSFNLSNPAGSAVVAPSGSGFNFIFDNASSSRVILDALSSITDVNIISSPRLMVMGEETARLQIGDQVPVATQTATPLEAGDSRIVNTVEFRDTGIILQITPHIGVGDTIIVDVDQEISDVVATTTSGIDSPTIRQRRVSSKVSLEDGETIAFAGLTRNMVNDVKSGIPIARSLPLVGPLFGSTSKANTRSELLILLTPRLVRNLEDARAVTADLKGKLQDLLAPSEQIQQDKQPLQAEEILGQSQ